MASIFSFANQRILILAPHPDDESLATGGMIQRALKEGGKVRVLFISDGENNPWPQRFLERRWRIGKAERQRWGAQRRQEALAALRCLRLSEADACFLGLPDQGTTTLLLSAEEPLIRTLVEKITDWQPTLLVAPSPHDLHPDHNALAVLVNLALARLGSERGPRLLHYLVHTRKERLPAPRWGLHLSMDERALKREAIRQHATQMALSQNRFLGYARSVEYFYPPDAHDPSHPIRDAGFEGGALRIWLQPAFVPGRSGELLVAFENPLQGSIRWRVPLRLAGGVARIRDAVTGRAVRQATLRSIHRLVEVRLPLSPVLPVERLAIKFSRRTAFYDEAGWREIALPASAPALSPVVPFPTLRAPSGLSLVRSSFEGESEVSA